jgi:mannose-6-phosphate isomerase-like protein (cupin superfamily)
LWLLNSTRTLRLPGTVRRRGAGMDDYFDIPEIVERLRHGEQPYEEFLNRGSLSVGVYHLAPGRPDLQQPHTEDEIYYVLAGEGAIEVEGKRTPVRPGSVVFVAKQAAHRFIDYPSGLTLLVVFAPARGSGS